MGTSIHSVPPEAMPRPMVAPAGAKPTFTPVRKSTSPA